ncbi:hypothetical protein O0L34_g13965 [Tuta absoluta]|nr:hypothetical protein O0L34_g13965 [Tuta absoluta]
MTIANYFLCVLFAVSLRNVRSFNPEEIAGIHDAVMPYIVECSKEMGIEDKALEDMKTLASTEGIECFFACVMKKTGSIDDKGLFATEKALEKAKVYLKTEKDLKLAEKFIEECSSVNDEDVNDGDAGCDRAMLIISCLTKHKGETTDKSE